MSKLSDKKALAEIKRNVKAMLRDAIKHVDKGVDHCKPAGIVEAHQESYGPFLTPREFLTAYLDEIKAQHGLRSPSFASRKRINNYRRFI